MGLVMSHTYNLSHAYLSHTHTVKHPTSVALLRATEWLDIETDSRQDAWLSPKVYLPCYSTTAISLWLTALSHAIKHCQSGNRPSCRTIILHVTHPLVCLTYNYSHTMHTHFISQSCIRARQ